jgi:CheY-like chemotaxis protein
MTNLPPILLVEDNDDDVFFMKRALQAAQINNAIHVAQDGEEAIEYLSGTGKYQDRGQFPLPALVLLDLKMPRRGGLEVLQWIREQPALRTLVVVILTTSRENTDIERAYLLGANSFLLKPSNTKILSEMMTAVKLYWLTHNQFFSGND